MTFGERLKKLSGLSNATVGAMLLTIGTGTTVGVILVNYSRLSTGTVSQHLLVDKVVGRGGGWDRSELPKRKKHIPLKVYEIILELAVDQVNAPIITLKERLKENEIEYDSYYWEYLKQALKTTIKARADEEEFMILMLM